MQKYVCPVQNIPETFFLSDKHKRYKDTKNKKKLSHKCSSKKNTENPDNSNITTRVVLYRRTDRRTDRPNLLIEKIRRQKLQDFKKIC